ncbi:unnamed protein product, partial [Soboliphyme baturini]|uniref:Sorting nexin-13 n=1 Tax=Soboliphyme baturini TaxID=241478 RepID=A0A183IXF6_9BILA
MSNVHSLINIDWVVFLTRDVVDDFATHIRLYRKSKESCEKMPKLAGGVKPNDIERVFFELENKLEHGFDRRFVSMSRSFEKDYQLALSSILSYILLPADEFSSKLSRFLIRDILAAEVIGQTVDLLSNPDYVVEILLWLLNDVPLKYEDFLTVLETCDSTDELSATIEILQKEIDVQRSKDIGGTDGRAVKQQLSSLYFLKKQIANRLNALQTSDAAIDESDSSWSECANLYDLSLTFVLCNNVALCHFIDFLCRTDGKHYIDLFLTIEGFKTSFGQPSTSGYNVLPSHGVAYDRRKETVSNAREVASELYKQFFSEQTCQVVDISDAMKKRLQNNIQERYDVNHWFDEVQKKIFDILEYDPRFYPAFKRSYAYVKLLAELRLLPTVYEKMDSTFCPSEEGIGNVQSSLFAVYHVSVEKLNSRHECVLQWTVNRRYSDFSQFNTIIRQKFPSLAKLSFPAKRVFRNLSYDFLEKRKRALESYLRMLLNPDLVRKYTGLEDVVLDFLSRKKLLVENATLSDKITSVVEPIRTGVKSIGNAVIAVPDALFDGVIRVSDEIGKATRSMLGVNSAQKVNGDGRAGGRVADVLNVERSDEVPFRILLLCLDEIFSLREKNQWIRRRMVEFVRQFVHGAFGSSFNRRIVEFVTWMTSEDQVASCIKTFRNSYMANGTFSSYSPPRPTNALLRSRLIAKGKLLTFIP